MASIRQSQIIKIFGYRDRAPSELKLSLAIEFPGFSAQNLCQVLRFVFDPKFYENAYSADSPNLIREYDVYWNRINTTIAQVQKCMDEKPYTFNLHSTFIIRNVYRLIEQDPEFSGFASKKSVYRTMLKIKNDAAEWLKKRYRDNERNRRFEDAYEMLALVTLHQETKES